MKSIFGAVLLAIILHAAECRRYGQQYEDEDEGDYGGPSGGRHGFRDQKGSQCGLIDQLSGLAQKLGLSNLDELKQLASGLIQKFGSNPEMLQDKLLGLAQKFGISGDLKDQLSGLIQKPGSPLGSGGGLLQGGGLRDKFFGKAQRSGSSSGRHGGQRKKCGSYGQGAESGRNGYGSDYGRGPEDSGRAGRYGSRCGRGQDRHNGYRRQNQFYEEDS